MLDSSPLWVKVCGLRDVESAVRVADLGADAIGINFYEPSPRCVPDLETARAIVDALPESATAVGVFVNHTAEEIQRTCEATGLRTVQLHGDEPVEMTGAFPEFRVIRALRIAGDVHDLADREMEAYDRLRISPVAWLVDARVADAYGGTGHQVDWRSLAPERRNDSWPPVILAGGLKPENVAEAVAVVRPWGVDVASGVESAPGVKDIGRVQQFIQSCRK